MGEYRRWGTLHPAGLPAQSVSTHPLTKAVSGLTSTISELTKSLWEKLWWHPLRSPIRSITTQRLHKLCCSCSTSPSSPCPLCSSVHQDNPQPGKQDLPNKHLSFYLFCDHICWISSLPTGVWSSRDTVSLFFSAAVNYDKHDKVMI